MLPGINSVMVPRGKIAGASPVVAGSATDNSQNASGDNFDLPSSISAGNLLILFLALGRNADLTVNTPSGWTVLFNEGSPVNGNLRRLVAFYKIASGSEGSSVGVSASSTCEWASVAVRITGATERYAVSSLATGTSSSANPPAVAVDWWKDNLVLAVIGSREEGSTPTAPSGYTNVATATQTGAGQNIRITVAQRSTDDLAPDPGTFSLGSSENWGAKTVVIG